LFIDQRANRAHLRNARAATVLNTFAYTCSFSVVAALGGSVTTSVDLSRKSLTRGEENFARNRLDPSTHRFIHADVLDLLPRLARRGERFDAIILDPPTFSRGEKGRRFQVESDFEDLLITALELAEPRAHILLSTNYTRLRASSLEQIARFALKATRRSATFPVRPRAFRDSGSASPSSTTSWSRKGERSSSECARDRLVGCCGPWCPP